VKLAVPFEIRIFLVVALVGIISVLVILDTPEPAGPMTISSNVVQGLQQPGEPSNTLLITGIDIGQAIGHKSPTITGNEFACFADRKIHTNAGNAVAKYSLAINNPNPGGFNGCYIFYGPDERNVVGLYMRCPGTEDMLSFFISFEPNLPSRVKDLNRLEDLEEKDLPIFGEMFNIVRAEVDLNANRVSLRLMGGSGYIDISDNYADNEFQTNIKVNGNSLQQGKVRIIASYDGQKLNIQSIEYRFTPLPVVGKDVYVPDHQGVKQHLLTPEGMLGDFDILFSGLAGNLPKATVPSSKASGTKDLETGNTISFKSAGKNVYNLAFVNTRGQYYKFPLVTTANGGLQWGGNNKNFVFMSGPAPPYTIGKGDLFAVNKPNNKRGVTVIAEYSNADMDNGAAYFKDLGGGDTQGNFDLTTGIGDVILGGNHFAFAVDIADPAHPMAVDHDGNGAIGGQADIVVAGGVRVILNPGFAGQVYVERSLFAQGGGPESTGFAFTQSGSEINADITNGPQMLYNDATDKREGLTVFGIFIQQDMKYNVARNLVFNLPGSQRSPAVVVSAASSVGGQAQGEVLVTCERSAFVKAAKAAKSAAAQG
jgi:hypothetical protein